MIYTTYYSKLLSLPEGTIAYAISNSVPAGIQLPRLWQAIPNWEFVKEFRLNGDWALFKERYLQQLASRSDSDWDILRQASNDIALVCYEKDRNVCHRSILADWLHERYGLGVREWGCIV